MKIPRYLVDIFSGEGNVEDVESKRGGWCRSSDVKGLEQAIDRLKESEQQVERLMERLKEDERRLDWLSENMYLGELAEYAGGTVDDPGDWRQAIDAAMASEKEEEEG